MCCGHDQCITVWTHPPTHPPTHLPPAVYADGGICLDILQNQWSPIYDVSAILTSIQVGRGAGCPGTLAFGAECVCHARQQVLPSAGPEGSEARPLLPCIRHPQPATLSAAKGPCRSCPPLPALQSLLSDPNPNSPANSEAARLFNENRCDWLLRDTATVAVWVECA